MKLTKRPIDGNPEFYYTRQILQQMFYVYGYHGQEHEDRLFHYACLLCDQDREMLGIAVKHVIKTHDGDLPTIARIRNAIDECDCSAWHTVREVERWRETEEAAEEAQAEFKTAAGLKK